MTNEELNKQLIDIFSSFQTKPILFFGSGMSKRYYNLPSWAELLTHYAKLTQPDNQFAFRYYSNLAIKAVKEAELAEEYHYPTIASLIESDYNQAFFSTPSFASEIKAKYHNEIEAGQSPFKADICDYFKKNSNETQTLFNEIIALSSLKNRVSNVITTNYDDFLEKLFINYKPLVGQSYIFNNKPHAVGNIFKIHGSIENPESIVLTQEDYLKFNDKSKFLSAKLLTLFIEFPIIFVGYSVSDVNIRNILYDIKQCLNEDSALKLSKRMLFIENTDSIEKQDIIEVEIAGIQMKKIRLFDYNILYDAFNNILDSIDVSTLRLLEDKIVQLIQSTDKSIERVYATSLENKELTPDTLAIYIAHESSVFDVGYSGIRLINICEDVLFHNKNYDPVGILSKTILSQKANFNRSKIPLYKYLESYTDPLDEFYTKNECIISKIDDIYSSAEKKHRLYKHPISRLNHITGTDDPLQTKINNIYLSLKALNISEVKEYIKSIWNRKNELDQTTRLTKIVCVIDWYENKKEH